MLFPKPDNLFEDSTGESWVDEVGRPDLDRRGPSEEVLNGVIRFEDSAESDHGYRNGPAHFVDHRKTHR